MHAIHFSFSHLLWCVVFSWLVGEIILLCIFFNCILKIVVSVSLINMYCLCYIFWQPRSILVSCPPILCFDRGYYSITFLQGVWHPPIECCLIRYLVRHRIINQLNQAFLLYIFNIHLCFCIVLPFNRDLPTFGFLIGDIGLLLYESIFLCECTTISILFYNFTHDQSLVSLAI